MLEKGAGNDLIWPPNSIGASASRKMSSPRVRITTLSGGPASTGRTRTRSVTRTEREPGAERDDEAPAST